MDEKPSDHHLLNGTLNAGGLESWWFLWRWVVFQRFFPMFTIGSPTWFRVVTGKSLPNQVIRGATDWTFLRWHQFWLRKMSCLIEKILQMRCIKPQKYMLKETSYWCRIFFINRHPSETHPSLLLRGRDPFLAISVDQVDDTALSSTQHHGTPVFPQSASFECCFEGMGSNFASAPP